MSRTLIRGAQVVTMSPHRPDTERVDLLVDDDRITQVGAAIDATGADLIDLSGRIVIPGLVNAHLHTWQSGLRCVGVDWTLLEYLTHVHYEISSHYRPDDMYIGTFAGALNQINSGTTTVGDWCHNILTPAHIDGAIEGLQRSRVRAVFFDGSGYKQDGPHPLGDLDRLATRLSSSELIDVGMAIKGPQYSPADVAAADLRAAQVRGIVVSMHHSGGAPGPAWNEALAAGLFGPHTNVVHGTGMTTDWVTKLLDAGASFTSTPENELGQGPGTPIIDALLRCGSAPSLGTDIDTVVPGDVLTTARLALAHQRGVHHARASAESHTMAASQPATAKQALAWATVEGARALGLSDRVGRIEPGMQADLVAIDARALNLWPALDPIAAALHAQVGNIEAVMIAGQWRKRDHQLLDVDLDDVRDRLLESSRRILA